MEGNRLAGLFLVLGIVLAGCTVPTPGGDQSDDEQPDFRITQSDGLSLSFRSLSTTYLEDDPIVLQLDIQNTGQSTASDITAELFGASFLLDASTAPAPQATLDGVDQAAQQSGESTTAVWRKSPPHVDLSRGDTQSFPAGVRVAYTYSTEARASFTVVPRNQFQGGSSTITTQNTAGPLRATVDLQSPKPISQPAGDDDMSQITVPVMVRNVGPGQVANINGERQQVDLTASFPNAGDQANVLSCGADEASNDGSVTTSVNLFDRSRQVICVVEIAPNLFETQLTLQVNLDYPYFVRQETSFTVEGLGGTSSGTTNDGGADDGAGGEQPGSGQQPG